MRFLGCQYRVPLGALVSLGARSDYCKYSLREDVKVQLSVDPQVWPLAPAVGTPMQYDESSQTVLQADDFPLMALDGTLQRSSEENSILTLLWIYDSLEMEFPISDQFEFIGFDVCDVIYRSAVANIGIGDRWGEVRNKYCGDANKYGLLASLGSAHSYARDFSHIVPEHAPYTVVAMACGKADLNASNIVIQG